MKSENEVWRKHSKYDRIVRVRDELDQMREQVPDGIEQAVRELNGTIMRMCHHDRREWIREELTRYENINRVNEMVECPHCRARTLITRALDYTPIGVDKRTGA